jgi:hypothetical protein
MYAPTPSAKTKVPSCQSALFQHSVESQPRDWRFFAQAAMLKVSKLGDLEIVKNPRTGGPLGLLAHVAVADGFPIHGLDGAKLRFATHSLERCFDISARLVSGGFSLACVEREAYEQKSYG